MWFNYAVERQIDQHLKDMVFRGAFFVILVYVLVFVYNSGMLNRLRRTPTPAPIPVPSPVVESQPIDETPLEYTQPESSESIINEIPAE